jgi:hypothetical protein
MKTKQTITEILGSFGIHKGRCISASKSRYKKLHEKHFIVFNSKLYSRRGLIARQVDLDLTIEGPILKEAAKTAGVEIFVLRENEPDFVWDDYDRTPISRVLPNAIWWVIPDGNDGVFLPVDLARGRSRPSALNCVTGFWHDVPAYAVNSWMNPRIDNVNMRGAAVELAGMPPPHLHVVKSSARNEEFMRQPSQNAGHAIRPTFYQSAGLLDFVWFSNLTAVPAFLFYNTVALLKSVNYIIHRNSWEIEIWKDGEILGYVWPCRIDAPQVTEAAHAEFLRLSKRSAEPVNKSFLEHLNHSDNTTIK